MSMRIVWILHVILKKNRIPINRFDIVIWGLLFNEKMWRTNQNKLYNFPASCNWNLFENMFFWLANVKIGTCKKYRKC